jgi:4-hydroxy-3-methylbut-2-enyl diphosphate reductase
VLVQTEDDADRLEVADPDKVAYITQTTLAVDETLGIIRRLRAKFPNITGPKTDDICYATQNRQDAVKRLAEEATLILVIGSPSSSNAQRLVEVAQAAGAQATLIDGESGLDPTLLNGHETIGLTAGASTPEQLVQATVSRLAEAGYSELEEITVAREDVKFRLPREVA